MDKFYRFAGLELAISIPDDRMYTQERYLEPFRVESVTDPHWFRFTLTDALPAPKGECIHADYEMRVYRESDGTVRYTGPVVDSWDRASCRILSRGKEHDVLLHRGSHPGKILSKTVLGCLEVERLTLTAGGFVFHSAFIEYDGKAILFTAPSRTGKSTQAELWRQLRGARIINGDRSVIRCTDEGICACGLPFSGSSEYCETAELPLAAVVYLGQAPRTTIRRMRGYEAFSRIWEGCSVNTWEREDMRRLSELVERIASSVPVYHMPCTPDSSAVAALETVLKEENHASQTQ